MALEQVKISTLPKEGKSSFLSQGEGSQIVLSEDTYQWGLRMAPDNAGGAENAKNIIAPSVGMLQVLAGLVPVFEEPASSASTTEDDKEKSCGVPPQQTGELRLESSIDKFFEDYFQWVFTEECGGQTITALSSRVPSSFPPGGRVYLVWEGESVKWEYVGGPQVPDYAVWVVTKIDEEETPEVEQVRISTITEQAPNQLAQAEDGKVVLSEEGDLWFLESGEADGQKTGAIVAPNLGLLQVLANLRPVFEAGCGNADLTGEVKLSTDDGDKFPWVFTGQENGGYTITAADSRLAGVGFPASGKVYLVWEERVVKWQWSGGILEQVPPNAVWLVDKVVPVVPVITEPVYQANITTVTKQAPNVLAQLMEGLTSKGIGLSSDPYRWYVQSVSDQYETEDDVRTITAPSLGALQVLASLLPQFTTDDTADISKVSGALGLSAGDQFPWVFEEVGRGLTISALPSRIPDDAPLPSGGKVYLVWEEDSSVQWQWSKEAPLRAFWLVNKVER